MELPTGWELDRCMWTYSFTHVRTSVSFWSDEDTTEDTFFESPFTVLIVRYWMKCPLA